MNIGRTQRLVGVLFLLVAAAFLLWQLRPLPRFYAITQESHVAFYADGGEALIHGIEPANSLVSYHMPLSGILAALIFNHAGVSIMLSKLISGFMEVSLVLALGCLLQSFTGAIAAAVIFLPIIFGEGVSFYYPQSFFSILILTAAGLLVWRARAPSLLKSFFLALSVGATLLYRSPLVFFLPLLALREGRFRRLSNRNNQGHLLLLCIVPYLFLIPWIAMNWAIYHRIIPFEFKEADANIVTGALGFITTVEGNWRDLIAQPIDENASAAVLLWAVSEVCRHPIRYAVAILERAGFAVGLHPFLFLFALLAAWIYRARREFMDFAFLISYLFFIHCLMPVQENYFTPLWPLLSLMAGSMFSYLTSLEPFSSNSIPYRASENGVKGLLGLIMILCFYTCLAVSSYGVHARLEPQAFEAAMNKELASWPEDAWLLTERATRRLDRGDIPAAVEDLSRAFAMQSDRFELELQFAWAKMLNGQPEHLFQWRFKGSSKGEGEMINFKAHVLKAHGYLRFGQTREARESLKNALANYQLMTSARGAARGPQKQAMQNSTATSDFLLRALGFIAHRPRREKIALVELSNTLIPEFGRGASTSDFIAQALLMIAQRARGEKIALSGFADKLAYRPGRRTEPPDQRHKLALLCQELQEYVLAVDIMRELVLQYPTNAVYFNDLGVNEYRSGSAKAAIFDLRTAISLNPKLLPAYISLGFIYTERKNFDEALSVYDKALSIGSSRPSDPLLTLIRESRTVILSKKKP